MVAHEKRNPAQLFCAVPTQNDLALSSLLFPAQPTQKLGYPKQPQPLYILQNHAHVRKTRTNCEQMSALRAFASQSFPVFFQRICAATHIYASKIPNIAYKARFFVFYAPPDAEPEQS